MPCFSTPYDDEGVEILKKLKVKIYKISSFEMKDINLVKKICKLLAKDKKDIEKNLSLISNVSDRKGHDIVYKLNPSKFLSNFNFKNKFSFNDGLMKTIDYYRNI